MKKRRFLTRCNIQQDTHEIPIEGSEARHLKKVLRLGPDDIVVVIDGRGRAVEARITKFNHRGDKVFVTPCGPIQHKDDRRPIILLVAPIKADKMAILVRQATECGVHTIVPVMTERTVLGLKETKIRRLYEIALQSLKQCRGFHAPDILYPIPLHEIDQALAGTRMEGLTRLLLSPGKKAPPLVRLALQTRPPWAVLIGPEGGLTDSETRFLKEIGFLETCLGPRILRTETASTVTIGILSNCQEMMVNGVRHHEVSVFEF